MAEILLEEQNVEFGLDSEESTEYIGAVSSTTPLEEGLTYTVVWDGTAYECTCTNIDGICVIGNAGILGMTESAEPFVIYYDNSDETNPMIVFITKDTAESHTIAVYKGTLEEETPEEVPVEEKNSANIVLYDRNGNPVTYENIETVTFNTDVEGETATYTHGTVPDEVPEVVLDFSKGNQTVSAETGKLMKSVVIQKPETLLAENIKKGVGIAGVEGTLIGEGVSKTVAPDFSEGDMTVVPDAETLLSEVVVKKPESLVPENIANGVDIGGVVGTASLADFDTSDEWLKYFTYTIDGNAKTITLETIDYDRVYAERGSYDLTIGSTIGGYGVIINAN